MYNWYNIQEIIQDYDLKQQSLWSDKELIKYIKKSIISLLPEKNFNRSIKRIINQYLSGMTVYSIFDISESKLYSLYNLNGKSLQTMYDSVMSSFMADGIYKLTNNIKSTLTAMDMYSLCKLLFNHDDTYFYIVIFNKIYEKDQLRERVYNVIEDRKPDVFYTFIKHLSHKVLIGMIHENLDDLDSNKMLKTIDMKKYKKMLKEVISYWIRIKQFNEVV